MKPEETRTQQTATDLAQGPYKDAWFQKEVEKSGRIMIVPASPKVMLIGLVVLMATITTGMGGMTLLMAQNWVPGVLALILAAGLIALIWYGLTKRIAPAPPPKS